MSDANLVSFDDPRPVQQPSIPGTALPAQILPIVVKNNPALAQKALTVPPHPQISQTLSGIPLGFQFSFNQLASPTVYGNTIDSYRIYRNTTANSFSGSKLIRTIKHDSTHLGAVTVQDSVTGGQNYYYFVTSVDTFGQESSQPGSFQSSAVTSGNANPNVGNSSASTSGPSTTSTSDSVIPEMTQTITTKGNKVLAAFNGTFLINSVVSGLTTGFISIFRDGSQISNFVSKGIQSTDAVESFGLAITWIDNPSAGSHTYDVRWHITVGGSGGSFQSVATNRSLQVVELG